MHPPLKVKQGLHIASRVAASVLGGYAFVWGFSALVIALGLAAGSAYDQAQTLAHLLAFLVFVACFCWAIATARLTRAWAVLAGGGMLMTGLAWALARVA
jgi:hypothetical protein